MPDLFLQTLPSEKAIFIHNRLIFRSNIFSNNEELLILPHIILYALLVMCFLSPLHGDAQLPDYHVQLFDESFGLRTDMERVLKDQRDFIWLLYNDRVQRFDGREIAEFYIGDGMHSILEDRDNHIWVTSSTAVYRFKNDKIGFEKVDILIDGKKKINTGPILQIPGKEVFLVTSRGFYAYNQKSSTFIAVTDEKLKLKTPVNTKRYSFRLFDYTCYYSCRDTIWAHDMRTGSKSYFPFKSLNGLYVLNESQIVLSNWKNQSFLYDFGTGILEYISPRKYLKNSENDFLLVSAVLNLDEHRHLLATTKGLLEFNSDTKQLAPKKLYFKGQPLSNGGRIRDLYMDSEKKIWACSEYTLMNFDPSAAGIGLIRNIETDPTRSFNHQIRGITPDNDGNLWLASSNGIIHWNIKENQFQSFYAVEGATDRMNHPSIRGIEFDGEYVIIGQTDKGVWLYHPKKKAYRRPVYEKGLEGEITKRKLEEDFIDQLYKLHNGNYIIVARDGGYVMEAGTYLIRQLDFPGRKENLNFAYEDHFRQVWIGTHKGLYCFDSNLVHKFSINDNMGEGVTRCLLQWDDKEYIHGSLGLFSLRIADGKIETSTLSHFFDQKYIRSLFKDQLSRLWITTDDGLYLLNRKTGYVESYDRFDNTQGDIFYQNCYYQNKEGTLFLGGTNGINYFQPDKMEERNDSLQVSLIKMTVNADDTIYYNRDALLSLDHHQNYIEIEYVAPFYGNPNRLQYRYKLKGLNAEWKYVESNNTIRFTSLPPGNYDFSVAASINGIDWYQNETSLPFNISYPFWQRWWFILCILLLVVGLVYYLLRKRIHVIQEKEKVKRDYERRIAEVEMHALRAQMNPHFMFNSLNSINNFILKNDPENASGFLTKFSRLMRLILDNSRSEWVLLENELKSLELYIEMEMVRFDNVFEYEIMVDQNVNAASTYVPPMIIQPYVENAIWHGLMHLKIPGGKLCIRIWREADQLHISIEDNGVGREEAKRLKSKSATKHKSHGMKITEERIQIINRIYNVNAKVKIDDLAGHNGNVGGTKVSLTLQDRKYDSHHSG